ncbi:phospho-N-acetylmuramoyl-pentapeptide-transferase [bacterium]|nr:phospho-N-acetylmuramoyl-pentapeptide-transferase [bacterium]
MIITIVAALVALVLSLLFGVVYLDFLKKKVYTQPVLEDAPETHAKKNGTPTTGGAMIVLAIIVASIIALPMEQVTTPQAFLILLTLFFFTLTGFQDDMQKITKNQNKGLSPKGKLFLQFTIALLPTLYLFMNKMTLVSILGFNLDLSWFYPIFSIFVITGASNAVNLTDGLDGLASSNCVVAFACCAIIALLGGNADIAIICAATAGACLGFLYFNKHPAQVFMGDTGSLALGGLLGTVAVMGKFELYLPFLAVIFIIETLSVMIQVSSFKLTGKRIFKMSPIHHHFELCNWSEVKIVKVFSIITLIFSALGVAIYWITKTGLI